MNRREALQIMTLMFGGTILGAQAFLSGCSRVGSAFLSASDKTLLNQIGEVIVPESETSGGAIAADVASFMEHMVSRYYSEAEQELLEAGLIELKQLCRNQYSKDFDALNTEQRNELIRTLEQKAAEQTQAPHYYVLIKQLTVWGWLTSEHTVPDAFLYSIIPEEYQPEIDYRPGDKVRYPGFGEGNARNFATHHLSTGRP